MPGTQSTASPAHPVPAGEDVHHRVAQHVSDREHPRDVRWRQHEGEARAARLRRGSEVPAGLPLRLPARLDRTRLEARRELAGAQRAPPEERPSAVAETAVSSAMEIPAMTRRAASIETERRSSKTARGDAGDDEAGYGDGGHPPAARVEVRDGQPLPARDPGQDPELEEGGGDHGGQLRHDEAEVARTGSKTLRRASPSTIAEESR